MVVSKFCYFVINETNFKSVYNFLKFNNLSSKSILVSNGLKIITTILNLFYILLSVCQMFEVLNMIDTTKHIIIAILFFSNYIITLKDVLYIQSYNASKVNELIIQIFESLNLQGFLWQRFR